MRKIISVDEECHNTIKNIIPQYMENVGNLSMNNIIFELARFYELMKSKEMKELIEKAKIEIYNRNGELITDEYKIIVWVFEVYLK